MRTFQQTWRRSLTGMIVWAALGTGGAAAADEPAAPAGGGKPEGAAAPQDPLLGRPHRPRRAQTDSPAVVGGGNSIGPMPPAVPSEPLRIKVFRLSHRDPEEVLAVLSCRFDGIGQPNGVYLPSITADRGKESATSGGGGVAGVRGPVLVGIPGGMGGGGPFGMAVPAGVAAVRVVVDYRTRSLVARGPEKELKALADTVARLDMAPGKPQPALKELRIFRLRHTGVNDVAQVLTSLGLTGVRMAMVARTNSLVVAGPEATLKEIAETVQALDVEVPAKKEGNAKSPAGPVQ